ncbi:MAG TPA: GNAT family N-acetyltransferase [Anditalea sp.]|nr:GNAT family N-acetyltransferase [Anditalea sp.]
MIKITTPPRTLYPQLINLWEASVRATHDFLDEEDILYFRQRILDEYFDLVDLYIATDEHEKLLGFLGLSPNKIEMLFIDPIFRNKGVGKQLAQYAIKQHQATSVDVNEQNPEAVGFYQKLGFKIVNRQPIDAEGKPFPILVMQFI